MGYDTSYNLTVRGIKNEEEFASLKEAMSGHAEGIDSIIGYALDHGSYDGYEAEFSNTDCVHWYEHDDDMIAISKLFPDMTFQLSGDGENNGDIWNAYYKNGEMEYCCADCSIPDPVRIQWKPHNPSKPHIHITETRRLSPADVRILCIQNELYTCSDNEAYDNMLTQCHKLTSCSPEELYLIAKDILDHSKTDFTVTEIMYLLSTKVISTYSVEEE